jgi:hypothetical protein
LLIKQLDRNRREAEKEKEKESLQCELQTETLAIVSAFLILFYIVYSLSYFLLGDALIGSKVVFAMCLS